MARLEASLTALIKASPAALPPLTPKAIIEPDPFGRIFLATLWSGWFGKSGWVTHSTPSWFERYSSIILALDKCLSILIDSVSIPWRILKALVGLIHGPISRIPSALAFIVNAIGPNSSAKDKPWYPG